MSFFDSRVSKFYVEEFDLTGFTTEMAANSERELRDVTVLGDTGNKFLPGHHVDKISWSGLYDDTAVSGSEAVLGGVLRTATAAKVITLWPGDAELGDIGYGTDQGWTVNPEANVAIGNAVTYSGGELEAAKLDRLTSLTPKATKTANFSFSSIDGAASSSNGGVWFFHCFGFAASGGNANWKVSLQDSANNSSFSQVGSETVTLGAVGAARNAFTGTLRRYVRARLDLDASSGTLIIMAGFQRL